MTRPRTKQPIPDDAASALLRQLPGVDRMLSLAQQDTACRELPIGALTDAIRTVLEACRAKILAGDPPVPEALTESALLTRARKQAREATAPRLIPVINATGIVVHTNLGRSRLADDALDHIHQAAAGYSTLEFDLATGGRGSRYRIVDDLICELTGAEAAMVVNNCAAAVLLCLDTVARGREVIVSRGELVEIGGSFRIPDIMAKSGCRLKEVGTTNRTHPRDVDSAITGQTGLLLKVHASNFSVVGFTKQVPLDEMVALGRRHGLPVMEDLGSGTLIDFSRYGLPREPTVQDSVAAGVDLITFSGDKLMGGPQAGLIVGRKEMIRRIQANPLTRALRIDKLTLAGLEATLRLYRDEADAVAQIPTLGMLVGPAAPIHAQADRLAKSLSDLGQDRLTVAIKERPSRAGGGSLPASALPSACVAVRPLRGSAQALATALRGHHPPVIGRIEDDWLLLDMRTVRDDACDAIIAAIDLSLESIAP